MPGQTLKFWRGLLIVRGQIIAEIIDATITVSPSNEVNASDLRLMPSTFSSNTECCLTVPMQKRKEAQWKREKRGRGRR